MRIPKGLASFLPPRELPASGGVQMDEEVLWYTQPSGFASCGLLPFGQSGHGEFAQLKTNLRVSVIVSESFG